MTAYPNVAPPSRVVRGEELKYLFRAVKGALHDLVNSSCTSGKNGTGGGCWKPAWPPPRNHSSRLEGAGHGGGFHTSHHHQREQQSTSGRQREHRRKRVPCSAEVPARSNGNPTGCKALEGSGTPLGEALTVILKSPLTPTDREPSRVPGRTLDRGRVWHSGVYYATPRWSCPNKKNMNHPRKLPQHAECPDRWGSDRDYAEASGNEPTQKYTGDKILLKRRDQPCCSFREIALLVLKQAHSWCGCLQKLC